MRRNRQEIREERREEARERERERKGGRRREEEAERDREGGRERQGGGRKRQTRQRRCVPARVPRGELAPWLTGEALRNTPNQEVTIRIRP